MHSWINQILIHIYIVTIFKIKVNVINAPMSDPWLTYFWPPLILLHNIWLFLLKRLPLLSIRSIVKLKSCFKLIAKFDFSNNNVVTFTTMCQKHKPQQFPTKYNKLKSTNRVRSIVEIVKRSIKRSANAIQNGIPFTCQRMIYQKSNQSQSKSHQIKEVSSVSKLFMFVVYWSSPQQATYFLNKFNVSKTLGTRYYSGSVL